MRKFTTEIFDTGVALVGYAVMLLVYDWRLALLSLLFTPFFLHVRGMDEKAGAARRCGVQKGSKCAERCHPRPRPECCDLPHLRL